MGGYRITLHAPDLFYVRFCTQTADAKGERRECGSCEQYPHWGNCMIKGRFLWSDYGGKEGALEAAKAFVRELKKQEAV